VEKGCDVLTTIVGGGMAELRWPATHGHPCVLMAEGKTIIIGRADVPGCPNSISRDQAKFTMHGGCLSVAIVGKAKSTLRRRGDAVFTPLAKEETLLQHGDEICIGHTAAGPGPSLTVHLQVSEADPVGSPAPSQHDSKVTKTSRKRALAVDAPAIVPDEDDRPYRSLSAAPQDTAPAIRRSPLLADQPVPAAVKTRDVTVKTETDHPVPAAVQTRDATVKTGTDHPVPATVKMRDVTVKAETEHHAPVIVPDGGESRSERLLVLLLPSWKPTASQESCEPILELALTEQRTLNACVCDGRELRTTLAATPCPWPWLPSRHAVSAELKHHPLHLDQWRLTLCLKEEAASAMGLATQRSAGGESPADRLQLDLARQTVPGPRARDTLGGVAGPMITRLLRHLKTLRTTKVEQDSTLEALRQQVCEREADLGKRIERLRAQESMHIAGWMKLVFAKEQRLAELDEEARKKNILLPEWQNSSDDES
jgi:hypothetical protein